MSETTATSTAPEAAAKAASRLPADAKPEEFFDFLKAYTSGRDAEVRKDVLDDRYVIRFHQPLPALDSALAKAYEATDERAPDRDVYALVFPVGATCRVHAATELMQLKIPGMVELLAGGIANLSNPDRDCMVLIHEKPKGVPLLTLLKDKNTPFPDGFLADKIINPIAHIIRILEEKNICHGHINLNTLYFGESLTVGQCVADTPGIAQPYLFEPLERALANRLGRGEQSASVDCYALGVVILHLALGAMPFDQVSEETFLATALVSGTYNALTHNLEFSEYLRDFLRGTLNGESDERWSSKHILQWVDGKRFNLIAPSVPKDAPRPFPYEGREHYNFKSLANGLYRHWDASRVALRDTKLARWVELSAHKKEVAETLHRLVRNTGGESNTSEKLGNELVARSIVTLDPTGPLRYVDVSTTVEGLGYYLKEALLNKRQKDLSGIADIIELDLANQWSDLQEGSLSSEASSAVWKLQKIKFHIRNKMPGFGLERALYDLCPHLPCQSPLVINHHVNDISRLLTVLDSMASRMARDSNPMDRHIAAFLASKLDMAKEVRLTELSDVKNLNTNQELITLKMLMMAQERVSYLKLPGLCHWMAVRLLSVVDLMHNRKLKSKLYGDLKKVARNGSLESLYLALISPEVVLADHRGFEQASDIYRQTEYRIEKLRDIEVAKKEALDLALKTSLALAYIVLCISLYFFAQTIQPLIS